VHASKQYMQTDKLGKSHISDRALRILSLRLKFVMKVPPGMLKKVVVFVVVVVVVVVVVIIIIIIIIINLCYHHHLYRHIMLNEVHLSAWLQWHHYSLCGYRDTRCTKK
jgi:hypothetical protein